MLRRGIRASVVALWAFVLPASVPGDARADAVSDFYKDKQVKVVVGYGTGGGYDVYARQLARHIGKHIPGSPQVIVQNMPGEIGRAHV